MFLPKLLSPVAINLITMLIGVAISWGMTQAHIQDLERDVSQIREALENNRLIEAIARCH